MGTKKSGTSRSAARKTVRVTTLADRQPGAVDALLSVAADYYWEQDAAYRFTVWRATGDARSAPLTAHALLGKTSSELCPAPAGDPEHWVRHRGLLDAREAFRDVTHALPIGAGAVHDVSLSGAPAYAPNGGFVGYRGVARESGALARMERLLELEGALLRGLAEADDPASVLPLVVRRTCELAGFESGGYWSVDEHAGMLRRIATSSPKGAPLRSALVEGAQVPAWLKVDPVWLGDPAEEKSGAGRGTAWSQVLIVPVAAGEATIGALEFRSAEGSSPDARVLQVLRGVAVQLGHLHARATAAERLRESEQRFASTMALAAIGISHVDDHGRFLYVNPQLCAMLGYSEAELLARTVREISHPEDVDATHDLSNKLRQGTIASFKAEKRYVRKDGTIVWAGLTVALKRDRGGRKLYDVSIVEDISARKEAELCIQYLANHDALTGLPNRARFSHLLGAACAAARRDRRRFAVLFVDLDRFKIINDTLGHEAGDATLRAAAARLRGCVRASDVVARLGGDEFVVLLHDVSDPSVAGKIAGNVLRSLAEPIDVQGNDCTISASIGICLHPDGDQEDQAVLRNADMAMYLAKQSGKNGYRLYANELNALSAERAVIEMLVRDALERGEYTVRFDARLQAATSAVAAFEARIRWTKAELAAVAPEKLAIAAEAGGLLVPLNRIMLLAACEAGAAWCRAGAPAVTVAVSLAAGQLTDPAFVGHVRDVLLATGLEPGMLELDVTEDALLYDSARAVRTLAALKALGVTIAIEAFGTGKASFADLQRFPIDALKLYVARVESIALDVDKQRYVEGVVALARALRLRVVATGVATAADAELLQSNGCFALQGPVAPRSLSADECAALLRERR
jgi:diguanylate cyclase (GGDEF)-like protein/PAS domain S-box-containing protein